MSNGKTKSLTVREHARQQGITLQTTHRRVWDGQVIVRRIYGRWLISFQLANRVPIDRNAQGLEAARGVEIERAQD